MLSNRTQEKKRMQNMEAKIQFLKKEKKRKE